MPGSIKWALIVALLATFVASFLDKGITAFITPAFKPGLSQKVVGSSRQILTRGVQSAFLGWNFVIPTNDSAVSTMQRALNSPLANPGTIERDLYFTPVTSNYNVTCTDFEVIFGKNHTIRDGNGCGTVTFGLSLDIDPERFTMTEPSPNRRSITMASPSIKEDSTIQDLMLYLVLEKGGRLSEEPCALTESNQYGSAIVDVKDISAVFPRTLTTKCFFNTTNTTEMAVITTTTSRITYNEEGYNPTLVATLITDKSNELLLAMNESTKVTTLPGQPHNTSVNMWIELRMAGSDIDIYACAILRRGRRYRDGKSGCFYGTIRVLRFRQPPNERILNEMKAHRGYEGFSHNYISTYMTLEHSLDLISNRTLTSPSFSTETMKKDTVDVTDYMARLGFNFYADFYGEILYIEYDIALREAGVEVPLWVLVVTGILMFVCLCVWYLTWVIVEEPYTSSLYSIIRTQMVYKSHDPIPRLMRFNHRPLMFEGIHLLPDEIKPTPKETSGLPDEKTSPVKSKTLSEDTESV